MHVACLEEGKICVPTEDQGDPIVLIFVSSHHNITSCRLERNGRLTVELL